jgi:hypothetical protein
MCLWGPYHEPPTDPQPPSAPYASLSYSYIYKKLKEREQEYWLIWGFGVGLSSRWTWGGM